MKLFNPENAHWYRRDGEALHSVPSAKGQPRPTTLRDARKLGLLPSVTNVLGVINKPELVEWKMTQAVLAALTLPRRDGEGEDAFAKRVVEDAQGRVRTAAEFGSAFHAGAEQVARNLEVDPAGPCAAWLNLHRAWFQANCLRVVWTERVLVNLAFGYAGTADLLVEHQEYGLTLVDYKTQAVRGGTEDRRPETEDRKKGTTDNGLRTTDDGPQTAKEGPQTTDHGPLTTEQGLRLTNRRPRKGDGGPRIYRSWCQQLAAYRRAIGVPMACLSVVVNSSEPAAPVEHLWSEDELKAGLESFEAALVIWRNEKGYDARGDRGL
jgi:hypothetical protein